MDIDDKLIIEFRKIINSNSNFVRNSYIPRNGKNLWNIICSCMDWISVSIRFLSSNIEMHEEIDVRVMQFFSVISAIDIVNEAIAQLHRVFFEDTKNPFQGEKDIFIGNKLNLDDNDYFKELRAMFGAHPVNLKHNHNEKWYASWPYDHYKTQDSTFELRLYSNKIGVQDITFGVNIIDLERFLIKRYGYLSVIEIEINRQYNELCEFLKSQPILLKGSPVEKIEILESESKKRLDNEYYKGILYELKKIFMISLKDEQLCVEEKTYKEKLLQLLNELYENLQQMKFEELQYDGILNPYYSYSDIGYSVSKLYNFSFDKNREPLFGYHMDTLNNFSNNRYNFSIEDEPDQVFLKLKMLLYRSKEKGNK